MSAVFREAINSDANRSVYTERVQYLASKICVLCCYSQNLYFTGAQNLYFAFFGTLS